MYVCACVCVRWCFLFDRFAKLNTFAQSCKIYGCVSCGVSVFSWIIPGVYGRIYVRTCVRICICSRIKSMRTALLSELKKKKTPGDWTHVTSQIGMFSYTGLTPAQVKKMIETHHIYMLSNGRISMAGAYHLFHTHTYISPPVLVCLLSSPPPPPPPPSPFSFFRRFWVD
jgi:hypothetical protein